MRAAKKSLKYMVVFLTLLILLTGWLVSTALIPQSAIKENVRESAEFLCEGELFGTVVEGVSGSKIDRYADSILLAIAYQYDREEPLQSVMWSSYYYTVYQNENENLLEAITYDYEPNQQYLRYWHGSIAVVRPLLLFFNIQQIYVLNGILLAVFTVWLFVVLWKRKAYVPAVGIVAGLLLTSSWFVPLSLEYTWTYFLMLLLSICVVKLADSGRWNWLGVCFLAGGMITNFMDFLTTETLTLTVPLLLVLWIDRNRNENNSFLDSVKMAGTAVMAWGIGYAGMWIAKWLTASVVLKENVMPFVLGHIAERLGADDKKGIWKYIEVLWRNIRCLFPIEYGEAGFLVGMLLLLAVCYIGYVYHKKKISKERVLLYAAVGLIPYLRYLILFNHSYLHYFFTYRAQLATFSAVAMILQEMVEWRWLIHADAGKRRH